MSDCMIIRRGGGGQGFDPNGAVLKVVTSTGCTVAVTNDTAGYSKTRKQADGYPRSNDEDVTEHFFSIPASAFGTLMITVSKVYTNDGVSDTLTASKTLIVDTAGKVYELLIAAPNIILNNTFGLQEGYTVTSYATYSARDRVINCAQGGYLNLFSDEIPVSAFTQIKVTASRQTAVSGNGTIILNDGERNIASLVFTQYPLTTVTSEITGVYYPTAELRFKYIYQISEIVLS